MEAVLGIIQADKISEFLDIPSEWKNLNLRIRAEPVRETLNEEEGPVRLSPEESARVSKRTAAFREKYPPSDFIEHLKKKLAEGYKFEFDAQKIIDGTETEEERQARYRMEKRAWPDSVAERVRKGEL